jgi:membrane glycosyltransferase
MTYFFTRVRASGISERHLLVLGLHTITLIYIMWNSIAILRPGGIGLFEIFLLMSTFIGCVPFVVDLWASVVGLYIIMFGNTEKSVSPYFDARGPLPELHSKTALTIYMRNEDPSPIFDRLLAMHESLSQTGRLGHFRFVLLSDTSYPNVMHMEEAGFERISDTLSEGTCRAAFYRRRSKNVGFKAGNAFDYVEHHSQGDDFFVPLDSDSTMSGDLLVRLVSSMERHPRIGLIQTGFNSTPSISGFSRIMYFYSNYVHNTGLSWFYQDFATYWGHNAIVRTHAFLEYCKLPVLKARPPLGGYVLSHDIIESIFMRRAGYQVKLLPVETGSYEGDPPTYIDNLRRELRWCRGIIQYLVFLKEPGLAFISRVQICQVLSTYLGPTALTVMSLVITIRSLLGQSNISNVDYLGVYTQPLFIGMSVFPRTVSHVYLATKCVKGYGDGLRWAISCLLRFILVTVIAPTTHVGIMAQVFGSFIYGSVAWDGQNRQRLSLGWRDAFGTLWLQTLTGISISIVMLITDGVGILRVLLLVLCSSLAVPAAVFTASPYFSRIVLRMRMCMMPEEVTLSAVLSSIVSPEIHALSSRKAKN